MDGRTQSNDAVTVPLRCEWFGWLADWLIGWLWAVLFLSCRFLFLFANFVVRMKSDRKPNYWPLFGKKDKRERFNYYELLISDYATHFGRRGGDAMLRKYVQHYLARHVTLIGLLRVRCDRA